MRRQAALMFTTIAACGVLAAGASTATSALAGAGGPAAASSTWGNASVLPGPGGTAAEPDTVSCASAGNCVAAGEYGSTSGGEAFVVDQTKGTWAKAEEVPGTAKLNSGGLALVNSVSCASAGNCSAGGVYSVGNSNDEQAFVVTETKGTWGKAEEVPGSRLLNGGDVAGVDSVSCASAGNCAAGGSYMNAAGDTEAFAVNETNGTWGKAVAVPGVAKLNVGGNSNVESVSCTSAGDCAAVGNYADSPGSGEDQSFVVAEADGTWGTAQTVPGLATLSGDGISYLQSVSCGAAGNCGAIGTEWNGTTNYDEAFVVNETSGTWGQAQLVPGLTALGKSVVSWTGPEDCYTGTCVSISCPSAGNCGATGSFIGNHGTQAFVVDETKGIWGKAEEVPGLQALNRGQDAEFYGVSCRTAGNCSAGGEYASVYNYSQRTQAFVVDETDGTWGDAEEVPGTAKLNTGLSGLVEAVACGSASSCVAGGGYDNSADGGGGFIAARPASASAPRSQPQTAGSPWQTTSALARCWRPGLPAARPDCLPLVVADRMPPAAQR